MTKHQAIEGINKRLGKMNKQKLERLLKFIDQKADHLSASGLPYTGDPETDEILDEPEMTRRLLEHKQAFEGLNPKQVANKLRKMEASGELIPWEKVKAELGL
jgi:hypothetical protein